jgi:UPF0716 family protein affecting phage T7 exclusion
MDRKFTVMLLVVCIMMMVGLLLVENDKMNMLRELKAAMREDDACCRLYLHPMMPYVCSLNLTQTNQSTFLPNNSIYP